MDTIVELLDRQAYNRSLFVEEPVYKVIRFYFNRPGYKRTIKTGLTLEEAQAHCSDPETSSSTCKLPHNKRRTRTMGKWFDGFTECKK